MSLDIEFIKILILIGCVYKWLLDKIFLGRARTFHYFHPTGGIYHRIRYLYYISFNAISLLLGIKHNICSQHMYSF